MNPGGITMDISQVQDSNLQHLLAFFTSMAIGLLMGLERERNPAAKAGLRTFTLVALFGTLSALLSERADSPWVLVTGLFLVGFMMIAAYFREPIASGDPGTTTVAAIIICYALGAMIWYGFRLVAVMLAVVVTILLNYKTELRDITVSLTRRDLTSILQFSVLSFIILPILPDRDFGPFNALNPYQIWWMVVLISGVSLAGYAALRIAGNRYGAPLVGIFGGLASSTATTMVFSRQCRNREELSSVAVLVILLANLMVPVRLTLLALFVAPGLLQALLPVLGLGLFCGLAIIAYWWRKLRSRTDLPELEMGNPTELRTALSFGTIYALVLFLCSWLLNTVGNSGLYFVALVSGMPDMDAIALSSMRLYSMGKIIPEQAVTAISLGFAANVVFKSGIILFVGGQKLALRCAVGMAAVAIGFGIALSFLFHYV